MLKGAIEDWMRTTPAEVAARVRAAQEAAAWSDRMHEAAALGFASVAEKDAAARDTVNPHVVSETNNHYLRMLAESYRGEHSEKGQRVLACPLPRPYGQGACSAFSPEG